MMHDASNADSTWAGRERRRNAYAWVIWAWGVDGGQADKQVGQVD